MTKLYLIYMRLFSFTVCEHFKNYVSFEPMHELLHNLKLFILRAFFHISITFLLFSALIKGIVLNRFYGTK